MQLSKKDIVFHYSGNDIDNNIKFILNIFSLIWKILYSLMQKKKKSKNPRREEFNIEMHHYFKTLHELRNKKVIRTSYLYKTLKKLYIYIV